MNIICPHCELEDDLIILPKVPMSLRVGNDLKVDPIVTEKTDSCCLHCYWQGTVSELRVMPKERAVKIRSELIVEEIKKRVLK